MKALLWTGVNETSVEEVPDPQIQDPEDIIVRVSRTVTCGSDLHLLGGYIPAMRERSTAASVWPARLSTPPSA